MRVAKDKAEHLDRLKSAFLANMSHEIRTPLNSIVGFASIIAELDAREERQEYLAIMQENTELLLQLISDILDLAKIEAGTLDYNMGYVDVSDFCKDVMRNYDMKEDKAVPVLLAPDLPDYRIYTDKKRLMQVVTNFINNALKFTSEGQILLEYHPVEGTDQIEFSVTDTGMGIAPDAVATVFDRFVRLNTFAKGTGLGLSICKSIIEHLGGTIGAESELGVGSRFGSGIRVPNDFICLYLCELQYLWIKNSVPMKNKTWTCLVVVSAALLMAGCGSRTKKQTNEDVSMDSVGVTCSGVKTLQLEGVQATWIQDNAGEHLMPRTIFPDASDELMESLSLQGGIPSSMSTFLVDTNGIRILLIREWELPAVVCCPDYNLWVSLRQILDICILPISMATISVE